MSTPCTGNGKKPEFLTSSFCYVWKGEKWLQGGVLFFCFVFFWWGTSDSLTSTLPGTIENYRLQHYLKGKSCSLLEQSRENFPEFQCRRQGHAAQERFFIWMPLGLCRDKQWLSYKLPRVLNWELLPGFPWAETHMEWQTQMCLAGHRDVCFMVEYMVQVTVQNVENLRHWEGKTFCQLLFLFCSCI